ncbi:hypothetical protein DEA8626_00902 [Defluviimonas aquaemixtae]|uniref:Antifreeze protein n=1 Tax=Albidovulum aquaemixtae TaxID=1542388 RepID=A0A2R8B433_9RHOB|nr:antifreeze protein [Defluviimonas aquaemixtae]SPH17384.1 hypothetical protein DEA8626_00902 [Defluviimonas aquaemixtae]
MRPLVTPFEFWRAAFLMGTIAVEAQVVIAMRLFGLAGMWHLGPSERRRMVAEKRAAIGDAWIASGRAALAGRGPFAQAGAALAPVRRRTKANRKRLTRKGLRA